MSSAQDQERLMAALGPHDIELALETRLPPNGVMSGPQLRGKLVCGSFAFVRLREAFKATNAIVARIGRPYLDR